MLAELFQRRECPQARRAISRTFCDQHSYFGEAFVKRLMVSSGVKCVLNRLYSLIDVRYGIIRYAKSRRILPHKTRDPL